MKNEVKLLLDVYQKLYGPKITMANLDKLAADLSQIAGRARPWTGKLLHSLLKGYPGFKANGHLNNALNILLHRLDGLDEVQTQAKEAIVLTLNRLPTGTIVLGQARRCATPGCQVLFVPTHPRQKYHSKSCAKIGRRYQRQTSQLK